MSTLIGTPAITPEELLEMPEGEQFELVEGQLVERNMSGLSSLVASRVNRRIGNHAEANQLGDVFDSDCGYQCYADDPAKIRRPDASFIRAGRLSLDELEHGYLRVAPDLAVEVVSPNDKAYELDEKIEEYLAAGVRLIWVVNPEQKIVSIHRLDGSVTKLHERDELSGEDVLQGFACQVAELFQVTGAKSARS